MSGYEEPLVFSVQGERLLGILHKPGNTVIRHAVLLVVGGPQYRVGSHRQFVLLARAMASSGIVVLRFDYRGMGDSSGDKRDFEAISEDISGALDVMEQQIPQLDGVVLWGLCDAATANAFYARTDHRIIGQIALNPWVRTEQGEAQAYIEHYYVKRLMSQEFWLKVLTMRWGIGESLADFRDKLIKGRQGSPTNDGLPERMLKSFTAYSGKVLFIISGNDLTAKEFESSVAASNEWRNWFSGSQVTIRRLEEADHTFSRRAWRDQVALWSVDWIKHL